MKKLVAFFLIVVYSGFIGGTLLAVPVSSKYEFEKALESNNIEINDSEPSKDIEVPHFTKIFKNLPGKIKLQRSQFASFSVKFLSQKSFIHLWKPALASREFTAHNTPLFIINSVFRI